MKPARYIVLPSSLNKNKASLYELQTKKGEDPDPLAPVYRFMLEGSEPAILKVAREMNAADTETDKAMANPDPRPHVTVKSATVRPCLYNGCRGLAETGKAFCPSHRPRP